MNNDYEKFISGLNSLAQLCKFELNEWTMEAYTGIFKNIGYDRGIVALKMAFMKIRGNSIMPSAMDLLEYAGITPPEAPKARDRANDISSAIILAIPKFGYFRVKEARAFLGEEAWFVVERFGGWDSLTNVETIQVPTVRAQLRDLAESLEKINCHKSIPSSQYKYLNKKDDSILIEEMIGELNKQLN